MEKIKIFKAGEKDCGIIARMHKENINLGFLNILGTGFLEILYSSIFNFKSGILLVAKCEENIVGFISGITDIKTFYKFFVKKNFIKLCLIILGKLWNIKVIRGIFEIMFYPQKGFKIKLPDAELLSIAVGDKFRSKGVARKLLNELERSFVLLNIRQFKVTVGETLRGANAFYLKSGFTMASKIEVHKNARSNIYLYNIK